MRYLVLSLFGLLAVIAYVQRLAISVPAADIQRDLGLTATRMGLVMGCWNWGYALLQLPAGWLADRWGSKPAVLLYAVLWSALTGCVSLVHDWAGLLAVWSLMGMAQAGVFPCATKAIGAWFPTTGRAFASGLFVGSMQLGLVVAPLLSAALLKYFTWQEVVALYAVPGVVWAIAVVALTPEAPRPVVAQPAAPPLHWARLARSAPMVLLCAQQLLRAAAMVFFLTWFPKYLQITRGVTEQESGPLTAQAAVGTVLGALVGGSVSDVLLRVTGRRRLSRQGVAVAGLACCAGLTVASFFVANTEAAMLLISAGVFCGTLGGLSTYPVTMELAGRHVATVFSVINMCGNLGAFLFPIAVGWFVGVTGQWDLALFLFAGIFVVAAALWALLNPHGPLFEEGG